MESAGVIRGLSGRGISSCVSLGAVPFVADGREAVRDLVIEVVVADVELEVVAESAKVSIDDEGSGEGGGVDVGLEEMPSVDLVEVC
jgi:hypothetical protein